MVWDGYNFCSASVRAGPVPEVHQWHTLGEAEFFKTQKCLDFFEKQTVAARWWQLKDFCMFIPTLGEMNPFWRSYFSNGLKRPTRPGMYPKILAKNGEKTTTNLNWWHRARDFPSSAPIYQAYYIPSPKFHDIIYIYIYGHPPSPRST